MNKRIILYLLALFLILPLSLAIDPWYNLTNFTDSGELGGIFKASNAYTKGAFGFTIYIGLFILLLFIFSDYEPKKAFASALFLTAIIGTILTPINIINPLLLVIVFVSSAVTFALLWVFG